VVISPEFHGFVSFPQTKAPAQAFTSAFASEGKEMEQSLVSLSQFKTEEDCRQRLETENPK
jgi:hypothetical protein